MEQENYISADFSIEALQNGDERAFELLFQHLYKALCFFAEKITKDNMTAEEDFFVKDHLGIQQQQ